MRVWGLVLVGLIVAGCGSSGGGPTKSYKTITCDQFSALANADDAVTNGALTIASDYMDASPVDPKGGASDAADFGDQILAACATVTGDTRIISLQRRVVAVFLAKHPGDRV
jgi:hypothetical protein